jgi:UDP-GlcNAc3NAcA epimerase
MKIVSVVGARPQFIKAAAIHRVLRSNRNYQEILLHTGQHYDRNMSQVFFDELDIPDPQYNLGVGSGTHAFQTGTMLKGIEEILIAEKPDWTLVYGDTNSTLAGALASVKLHIPVAHVEAGLRSFNRNMPEEINRIVSDRIADLLFAPTKTAIENLRREGLENITCFTGDVMFDSVLFYMNKIIRTPEKYQVNDLPGQYCLATIHRAENTDDIGNLINIFKAFGESGSFIVLPIHPRTKKLISQNIRVTENVRIIDPVGYLEMLKLTMDAYKILTDSGGLQKEAYFLGRPCITLRNETEWLETVHDGWNIITGADPDKIIDAINSPLPASERHNEFGDGHASEAILARLSK